jgi:DNA-binding GntR family transcriptional regulator
MSAPELAPLQPMKGADLYMSIRNAITSGHYVPGQRLSERELAVAFRASRTPVREAFRLLMQAGLVSHVPYRGYRVAQISEDQARHVMAVREALEGLAARLASQLDPKRTARAMEKTIEDANRAHKQGRLSDLITANQRFHLLLVEGSQNPILVSMFHNIQTYVGLMMSVSLAWPRRPEKTLREHWEIIRALRSGKPGKAEKCVRTHIHRALQGMLRNIKLYLNHVPEHPARVR